MTIRNLHHPSCSGGSVCICQPVLIPQCEDCGAANGFHAIACVFWDDRCRDCAAPAHPGQPCTPRAVEVVMYPRDRAW